MSAWLLLATAVAGGVGAVARFEVDAAVARWRARRAGRRERAGVLERRLAGVPLGTMVVNVSACALLGVLTGALAPGSVALTVLGTGVCGGYSTFSTASVESARLVLSGRVGAGVWLAAVMTVVCQGAAALGLLVGGAL